ncbi:16S rRNA (cytosine(1407)-C(5))-methyltransferase RsmF [Pseudoalteromonas fenneropenaei]|uniref:Ribosomal RNA small subunit methyltransferase F n=1 Tax=Pseudoalteromonas fenneropenaei TaxID=1737459 RepID=A0ABV7CF37_9GAMM
MHSNLYIPDAFLADVASYIPEHLNMADFVAYCQQPLRRAVRVNTLKMSIEAFKQACVERSWQLTPIPWCAEGFWLTRPAQEEEKLALGNTDLHLSGCMYVQEASSMLPPMALREELHEGGTVLDMAAAPGSKTSQLAALMANQGVLVANEYSSSRVKVLAATMKRMGIYNVALSHFDGQIFGEYMPERFDHILLDAPCSGEGTVRKDEDALKNWSLESNLSIAQTQKTLIESAFHALKPGGTLVYSTCTLTPVENQQVCQHLIDTFGDAVEICPLNTLFDGAEKATTAEGYLHVWPQIFDSEGFFIAKFKKRSSVPQPQQKTKKGAFPFQPLNSKDSKVLLTELTKQFGITTLPGAIYERDKEVWLFPAEFADIAELIKYQRIGILIGTRHKNGVRWEHELATALGHLANKNCFALNNQQAQDYFQGKDVELSTDSDNSGEVFLTLCGTAVGLGKWQKHKIKNSLPRDLVLNNQLITWV